MGRRFVADKSVRAPLNTRIALNCHALSKTCWRKFREIQAVDELKKCIITTETQRKKRIAAVGGNAEIPKNQQIKTSPNP
jgi:hypothetical protein